MPLSMSPLLRIPGMLVALLCVLPASLAQANTGHEGWYQVEMIVFTRRNATTVEQWPKTIKLRYPTRWVELKDPAKTQAQTSAGDNPPTTDFTKEPYWQLPTSERNLNNQARILERNPGYQVLFHQAWRQEITNDKQALGLLVSGGQAYGKHLELEGSITLSVATYLKISTNLWFSKFDVNLGELEQDNESEQKTWPEIPLRPNYAAQSQMSLDMDINEGQAADTLDSTAIKTNLMGDEEKEPYTPSQIVLMKQERDMRSNEIHYLDHPLLGIIIKIVPYRP